MGGRKGGERGKERGKKRGRKGGSSPGRDLFEIVVKLSDLLVQCPELWVWVLEDSQVGSLNLTRVHFFLLKTWVLNGLDMVLNGLEHSMDHLFTCRMVQSLEV